MQSGHSRSRALFVVFIGGVCISFAPVFVRMLDVTRIGATAIGFWRTLFGAVILFSLLKIRSKSLTLPAIGYFWAAMAGLAFFVDLFAWHRSIFFCGSGMATILGNTQIFGSSILGYFVFKEKLSIRFFLAAVSALVGVALLAGLGSSSVEFTERYVLGIFFGLITGIAYANYIISLKKAGHAIPKLDFVALIAWMSLFCATFLGISTLIEDAPAMPPDATSWLLLFGLGLVAQSAGWIAISSALPKLGASQAGLVLLIQPTLATIWGVLFFHEYLTGLQAAGAALTLGAIYLGSLK